MFFYFLSFTVSGIRPNPIDSLPLPPVQQFYIQVLSNTTGLNTGYLDNTGQTHSQCHLATQWHVTDESLCSGNGTQFSSVPRNVPYVKFGGTDILNTSSLDRPLMLKSNGYIAWQDRPCTEGAATFGQDARGILYAIFTGSGPGNLTSVLLQALDGMLASYFRKGSNLNFRLNANAMFQLRTAMIYLKHLQTLQRSLQPPLLLQRLLWWP